MLEEVEVVETHGSPLQVVVGVEVLNPQRDPLGYNALLVSLVLHLAQW